MPLDMAIFYEDLYRRNVNAVNEKMKARAKANTRKPRM
jgi:hypothetical protein